MSESNLRAQLKSIVWAIVAALDAGRAIAMLEDMIREIRDEQWRR